MISPVLIVVFTGHRTSGALGRSRGDLEGVRDLVKAAFEGLRRKAELAGGGMHLFCSVAEGADVIAGEMAREMGIPLHVILPLAEESFREDFEDRVDQWPRSEALIRYAEITPGCSVRVVKAASKRPDCYVDTNAEMLDAADALVAVSTESEAGARGGAGHVCALAEKRGLPFVVINPETQKVSPSNLERFAVCESENCGLELLQELNEVEPDHGESKFECYDRYATQLRSQGERRTIYSIILYTMASVVGALGTSILLATENAGPVVAFLFSLLSLSLVLAGEYFVRSSKKRKMKKKWLLYRYAAELLRPLAITGRYFDPLSPRVGHHRSEWRMFFRVACFEHASPREDLDVLRDRYLSERIEDQLSHFRKQHQGAQAYVRRCVACSKWLGGAAIIALALAAVIKSFPVWMGVPVLTGGFAVVVLFLPVALPLLAGVGQALRRSSDLSRRSLRYEHMIVALERAKESIEASGSEMAFLKVVDRVEELLLDELNEFYNAQEVILEG